MKQLSRFSKLSISIASIAVVGLLTGCGADDTEEQNTGGTQVETPDVVVEAPDVVVEAPDAVVAAQSLPAVNTELATESPAGVWMILADEASTLPNSEDSMNPFIFEKYSRELVVIADNGDGIYTMSRCDTTWRDDYTLTATETGYSAALSEASAVDDSGVTYTTVTNFEVVYDSDNQTLTATGSKLTTPVGEDLTLAVNGVKISDSTDFSTAPDFTALATLEYINLGNGDADPAGSAQTINDLAIECLGISNGTKTTESTEDEWLLEQAYYTAFIDNGNADTTDQIQYYRLDQNTNGDETRSLGAVIDVDGVFTMYVHACSTENTECLAAAEWTETVTSSATGLAFDVDFQVVENTYVVNPLAVTPWTAFLWPHDGDYMHAVVSMEEN